MNNLLKHRCKLRNSKVRIYINQKLLIAIYSLYTDICVWFHEINIKNSLVLTRIKFSILQYCCNQKWKLEKGQKGNEKTEKKLENKQTENNLTNAVKSTEICWNFN